MKPFVKWAGGKRQILDRINGYIDETVNNEVDYTYIEPFLGGGAVFFDRMPKNAIINDLNSDLINAYKVIQSNDYQELIKLLEEYIEQYNEDKDGFYYDLRAWDRTENWPNNHTNIERAARMIFLNRTCYNGLYRVNGKGQFNTPIGRYKNPTICDKELICEIHNYLSCEENNIEILNGSYEKAIDLAKDGDIIYIDPPYDYEDDDGFTKYQMNGFTFDDFIKLKDKCDEAICRGATVIISNNATKKVLDLFEQDSRYEIKYEIDKFSTLRNINCNGLARKTGQEVIIKGTQLGLPQANDINKIIKLLMSDESVIADKNSAMEILGVTTPRQVAYYTSALQYLNYLTKDYKFNDNALKLDKDPKKIKNDVFNKLLEDPICGEAYRNYQKTKINNNEIIVNIIKKSKIKLADSTIRRRASTLKAWVDWMISVS